MGTPLMVRTILVALALLTISMPSIAAAACSEVPTEPLASEESSQADQRGS
jgi:hypothetical protein